MTDHPILYSAPMVRAQLEDRKTQTRRTFEKLRRFGAIREFGRSDTKGYDWHFRDRGGRWHDLRHGELLPYLPYQVGDRLWVKEAWRTESNAYDDLKPADLGGEEMLLYDADGDWSTNKTVGRTRVSIHMPRWASRTTNIVEDVRIERLQDISEAGAIAEGVWHGGTYNRFADDLAASCIAGQWFATARDWYSNLWDRINGPGTWDSNPYVIAYTVRVIRQNIDQVEGAAA